MIITNALSISPVIGGFVAENKGWRWTQWTQLFFTVASYLFSAFMSETYKKTILERRAKRLGVSVPKTGPSGAAALKLLLTVTLFRPLSMLITEPIVSFFSLYIAFNFAVIFAFFDAFPIVFEGVYRFNLGQVGLTFLGLALGCCLAVATFILVDRFTYQKFYRASLREGGNGAVAPEHRLYSAMLGSVGLPVGLFWFGWTARADIHWISPVLAAVPFGWGNIMVFVSDRCALCPLLCIASDYGRVCAAMALFYPKSKSPS